MRASDVMTLGAASIRSTAPIEEAARLMVGCRISGLSFGCHDFKVLALDEALRDACPQAVEFGSPVAGFTD